jgi:hypothetical protein
MREIPKGFTCECGEFHEFGFYIAAHSTVRLTHTCVECGAKHGILDYRVALIKKGRKRRAARKEASC